MGMNNLNTNMKNTYNMNKAYKLKHSKNIRNYDFILQKQYNDYNKIFLRSIKHEKISEIAKYFLLNLKYENCLLKNKKFCQQFIEEERNKTIEQKNINENNFVILFSYWYHEKHIDHLMLQYKYKNILIFINELIFYNNNIKIFHIY